MSDCVAEKSVPFFHLPYSVRKGLGRGLFEEERARAVFQCPLNVSIIAVGGENEDPGVGNFSKDLPSGFQAVKQRHGDIHHNDGWLELFGQLDRLAPRFCLCNDFYIRFRVEHGPEALAYHRMIIGQEDGNWFHSSA